MDSAVMCLLAFSVVSLCVDVNLTMQPLKQINQKALIIDILLKPNQIYKHHSYFINHIPYIYEQCHNYVGQLMQSHLSTFPISTVYQDEQYKFSEKYGIIYKLDNQSIQAFKFSNIQNKLQYISKQEYPQSNCKSQIVLSGDKQYLYHFSCLRTIAVQMKRSLGAVKPALELDQPFHGYKVEAGLDYFAWISYDEGLRVYAISSNHTLKHMQSIFTFIGKSGQNEKIVDMYLAAQDNLLFLLGIQSNIYVLHRLGNGTFASKCNISLQNICSNCKHRRLLVFDRNIFIYSIEEGEQFVSQLQYYGQLQKVSLVRYYKGTKNMIDMYIYDNKLMMVHNHILNIYQINIDPRVISKLINGISNVHFQNLAKLHRIGKDTFIKSTTNQGSSVIKLAIKKPYIQCKYPQQLKTTQIIEINQPCRQIENIKQRKYYQNCITKDIIKITVRKPEQPKHVVAVLSVFTFFSVMLIFLLVWRKGKMDLIESIVRQINKIKNSKAQDRIEFIEQKQQPRTNWSDIHSDLGHQDKIQQFQIQMKEKVNSKQEHKQEIKFEEEELHQEIYDNQFQGTQRNMMGLHK